MGLFLESAQNEQLYMKEDTRKQNLFMQEAGGGTGKDGKSAYEIWLEQGNEGTEEDFIESLKGEPGYTPQKGVDYFDGKDGYTPQKGVDYFDGKDGKDGEDYILTEEDKEEIAGKAAEKVEIPAEYVTETELEAKGYQTKTEAANAYQPKGSYATTEQLAETEAKIPTKVSQLGNDKNYIEAETDPTVPSWAKAASKPTYTKSEIGLGNVDNVRQYSANNPPPYPVTSVNGRTGAVEVEEKGTAQTKVTNHNADDEAHNDIRLLISALTKKVNDLLDSDDTTLDQMSEVVAYIKANRELLESYTTEKVNVADIIDNLTTSVSNKPLSAKQGVQLKALIDAIKVPTALSQLAGDSTHRTVTDSEKAAWNAKSDFSGEYADLKNKPTKVTDFTNDAGYQTAQQVQNYAQPKGDYITEADLQEATNDALEQAKNSGAFNGPKGDVGRRGNSVLYVTTKPTKGVDYEAVISIDVVKEQSGVDEVLVGDIVVCEGVMYRIASINTSIMTVFIDKHFSANGLSIYTAKNEGIEDPECDRMFNMEAIETNGIELREGEFILSPSGLLYKVDSLVGAVLCSLILNLKGEKGDKGDAGRRGTGILKVTTAPSSYTTATGGFTPTYRIALSTVKTQASVAEVLVGDTLAYNYYQYPIGYVDSSYVYLGARTSIRGATGATGPAYTLTDPDKEAIAAAVKSSLTKETWTFTLEDGTTVTKAVYVE